MVITEKDLEHTHALNEYQRLQINTTREEDGLSYQEDRRLRQYTEASTEQKDLIAQSGQKGGATTWPWSVLL